MASDEDREAGGAGDLAARVVSNAAHDIGGFIRAQREAAHVSMRQLAELAGVSNPYLSQIERGLRKPSAEVLGQIAKGLRLSSEVLYIQAGYLEQRPHSPTRDALLADTAITERQKQVLLEIYESFCRENGSTEAASSQTSGLRAEDQTSEPRTEEHRHPDSRKPEPESHIVEEENADD
ncbi:helix-turn-helix transcriptional regulator [Rhodococcus sp. NPDC049939]|uniref:helix-turn-helix domain-containing protein n=1 Tax=Rhodococcus sp. NPDC049939 TaxID=3155511 RepID=UPI0033F3D4B8